MSVVWNHCLMGVCEQTRSLCGQGHHARYRPSFPIAHLPTLLTQNILSMLAECFGNVMTLQQHCESTGMLCWPGNRTRREKHLPSRHADAMGNSLCETPGFPMEKPLYLVFHYSKGKS